MCEFCSKHKRKKWFLDPDNYSEKMLENKRRMNILQKLAGFGLDYELRDTAEAVRWTKHPLTKDVAKHIINKIASSTHSGQVITLQDALEIID